MSFIPANAETTENGDALPAHAAGDECAGEESTQSKLRGLPADSLSLGIAFMLVLTVGQRFTGFLRGIFFCRFLSDEELGLWSLAFSFLLLAAPLAVLGLPGSFGRYVEYYHHRGQLRSFLRRTLFMSALLTLIAITGLAIAHRYAAWIVFKDTGQIQLIWIIAASIGAIIAFNFLNELLMAMRQVRAVSMMQFVHSLLFTTVGVTLVCATTMGASALVVAYASAGVIAVFVGMYLLWKAKIFDHSPIAQEKMPAMEMWRKLLPFAGWVWVINLFTNLFDTADRYMILHLAKTTSGTTQGLVGQYHSSRIVPMLLVAIAGMLGSIILPYLAHDWEAKRKHLVSTRLNLVLKLLCVGLTLAGIAILLNANWLFGWALGGKYADGLSVLPWTLTYCCWFSLFTVAQTYLWCAEKGRLCGMALAVGLGGNLVMNLLLVPFWGLAGAVVATAISNAIALGMIYWFNQRAGMKLELGVILLSCLPLTLAVGVLPAAIGLVIAIALMFRANWLLSNEQREEIRHGLIAGCDKLKLTWMRPCFEKNPSP